MASPPWKIVAKEVSSSRMQTCKQCPHFMKGICKKCGCVMRLKVKIEMAKCPIGKW